MGRKAKVTVCVPIYNAEKYIKECLDSLVSQSLKELEIVCVNDGSTDNSGRILEEYKNKYNNIKVINQENKGLGGARNAGIKASSGQYIGFVDADDFVEPKMYETLYNIAIKNGSDIAFCNVDLTPHNQKTRKKAWFKEYKGRVDPFFLNKNTQPWNKIVSKRLIDKCNFKFYEQNGDGMYVLLMVQANGIVSTNKKLYNYRVGHSSMSTDYKIKNFQLSIESAREQLDELKKTNKYDYFEGYFVYRIIYSLLQGLAIAAKTNNKALFKQYKAELIDLEYKKNKYLSLLKEDFSTIEYVGIVHVLPANYTISKMLTKIIL
ncbi:glycosyltransferase [Candidatus Saccharibacteria bacterium]|nr:glycosyltransferase [Candidatus Saccharibacteria bacterium]